MKQIQKDTLKAAVFGCIVGSSFSAPVVWLVWWVTK